MKLEQARGCENVEYQLIRNGLNVALFQEYPFAAKLIKAGLISPLWINKWYAPLFAPLLGYYATTKRVRNGVTTVGKALIAGRLNASGAPAAADYIAVGTGTGAFAAADTTLGTETAASGLTRAAGTVSLVTTTTTNDTAQVAKTFTVTGTVAVTESGVLNASSGGTLLCRQTFTAINVVNGDFLVMTWKTVIA